MCFCRDDYYKFCHRRSVIFQSFIFRLRILELKKEPFSYKKNKFPIFILGIYLFIILFFQYARVFYKTDFDLCFFHYLTGYPCPTCGATRVVILLFQFRFVEAFFMNPFLFVFILSAAFLFILRVFGNFKVIIKISKRKKNFIYWVVCLMFFLNWFYLIFFLK